MRVVRSDESARHRWLGAVRTAMAQTKHASGLQQVAVQPEDGRVREGTETEIEIA